MEYDLLYKIVLVGDCSVGKTNLLAQYTHEDEGGYFDPNQRPTIGVEFGTKTIITEKGVKIKAQIWDTAGQERYRSMTSNHYRRATGAIIVYDVTNPKSLESVKDYWVGELKKSAPADSILHDCIMVVGNKIDLISAVSEKKHNSVVNEIGVKLHGLTSAKTSQNVVETFERLIMAIYEKDQQRGAGQKANIVNLAKGDQAKKQQCC